MDTTLDKVLNDGATAKQIMESNLAVPVERMKSTQVLLTYTTMGTQLQTIVEAYKSILDATPQRMREHLLDIEKFAKALVGNCEKLRRGDV